MGRCTPGRVKWGIPACRRHWGQGVGTTGAARPAHTAQEHAAVHRAPGRPADGTAAPRRSGSPRSTPARRRRAPGRAPHAGLRAQAAHPAQLHRASPSLPAPRAASPRLRSTARSFAVLDRRLPRLARPPLRLDRRHRIVHHSGAVQLVQAVRCAPLRHRRPFRHAGLELRHSHWLPHAARWLRVREVLRGGAVHVLGALHGGVGHQWAHSHRRRALHAQRRRRQRRRQRRRRDRRSAREPQSFLRLPDPGDRHVLSAGGRWHYGHAATARAAARAVHAHLARAAARRRGSVLALPLRPRGPLSAGRRVRCRPRPLVALSPCRAWHALGPCSRPVLSARALGPCSRPVLSAHALCLCSLPVLSARALGPRPLSVRAELLTSPMATSLRCRGVTPLPRAAAASPAVAGRIARASRAAARWWCRWSGAHARGTL